MLFKQTKCEKIKKEFLLRYSKPKSELNYQNSFQLLVSVVLSAQCTDKRVNLITPKLFELFGSPEEMAKAEQHEIQTLIYSCSFANNKSKYLIKLSQQLINNFNSEVPLDEEKLQTLAGVGRKTAHVVLIELLDANLMAVDTHVFRTAHRLGLSEAKDVVKTEKDLVECFQTDLATLHQAMVLFGRYICKSKSPDCEKCFLKEECVSKESFKAK
jgi:endonuclease-3